MKKILTSLLLFPFFSVFAATNSIDPDPQVDALERILLVLNAWVDKYPQCYQDVADIKQIISELQNLTSTVISEISAFHGDFAALHGELGPRLVAYEDYLKQISDGLASHSSVFQNLTSTVISEISAFHGDFAALHGELGYHLPSFDNYLNQILQLISEHFSKLPDFKNWTPEARVTNFSDMKQILKELFQEIVVNAHLDSDLQVKVNAQFDFDYDYLLPSKQFHYKANQSKFSLNSYTRFHPRTWLYNADDSMGGLVTPSENTVATYDFLDFMCSCGNALVSQNQDVSMLLCQILGFFKSGKGDDEQLKTMATTAADGASQDIDSLKSAFHASSLEDVAGQYFVDLNIDDKFDSDFLGFAHGSGASCPDFIDIGPIPFSKIYSSMTDYTLHFSTAGLKSFFDICRQCFTVLWYLFFLTICIFLARFGWAFLKPILRTLTHVLNW